MTGSFQKTVIVDLILLKKFKSVTIGKLLEDPSLFELEFELDEDNEFWDEPEFEFEFMLLLEASPGPWLMSFLLIAGCASKFNKDASKSFKMILKLAWWILNICCLEPNCSEVDFKVEISSSIVIIFDLIFDSSEEEAEEEALGEGSVLVEKKFMKVVLSSLEIWVSLLLVFDCQVLKVLRSMGKEVEQKCPLSFGRKAMPLSFCRKAI